MSLDSSAVTDAGMAVFEGMRRLESLDLSDTKVGDAGLAHLSKVVTLVRALCAANHLCIAYKQVANRNDRDFRWEVSSRGRVATPADSPPKHCIP